MYYYGNTTVGIPSKRKEDKKKEDKKKQIENKRNKIKDIYNTNCCFLPQIQKLTEKREKAIDKFMEEFTEEQFTQICLLANSSNFLIGKNDKGWKADFDFLLRIDKATNVLEGKYSNTNFKGKLDDFKDLMEEAQDEQTRNNTNNNAFSW